MTDIGEMENIRAAINKWTSSISGLRAIDAFLDHIIGVPIDQLQKVMDIADVAAKSSCSPDLIRSVVYSSVVNLGECYGVRFVSIWDEASMCRYDPTSDWEYNGRTMTEEEKVTLMLDMQNAVESLMQNFYRIRDEIAQKHIKMYENHQLLDIVCRAFIDIASIIYDPKWSK